MLVAAANVDDDEYEDSKKYVLCVPTPRAASSINIIMLCTRTLHRARKVRRRWETTQESLQKLSNQAGLFGSRGTWRSWSVEIGGNYAKRYSSRNVCHWNRVARWVTWSFSGRVQLSDYSTLSKSNVGDRVYPTARRRSSTCTSSARRSPQESFRRVFRAATVERNERFAVASWQRSSSDQPTGPSEEGATSFCS